MTNFQRFIFSVSAFSLVTAISFTQQVFAASEAECGNYLCMPQGYTDSACDEPREAMRDRIKDGKSALPPYHECAAEDTAPENTIYVIEGVAARYEDEFHKGEECEEYKAGGTGAYLTDDCVNYKYVQLITGNNEPIILQEGEGVVIDNTRFFKK